MDSALYLERVEPLQALLAEHAQLGQLQEDSGEEVGPIGRGGVEGHVVVEAANDTVLQLADFGGVFHPVSLCKGRRTEGEKEDVKADIKHLKLRH